MPSSGDFCPGSTHSRSLECYSRQAVQTQPSDPDRVVPISAGVQSLVLKMGPATCRPLCNPVQSQAPQVCITGTGSNSLGSRRRESTIGESVCLRLPSSFTARPSNLQGDGSRLSQNDSDCSRVAQHAMVLGPSQSIGSDSLQAPPAKGSGDTTLQSKSTCLALPFKNKGSLTKWQQ